MSSPDTGTVSVPDTYTGQLDPFLSSLFLVAAAVILAIQDPIYLHFQARPVETFVVVGVLIAALAFAVLRRNFPLFFTVSSLILVVVAAEVITQPTQLSTPVVTVWPLRVGLVLLVGLTWGFLLHPPAWLTRALVAFAVPSLLALGLWGGPALAAQLFNTPAPPTTLNFAPYYMAINSQGSLYATDIDGNLIWVFDSSGSPVGMISPGKAPAQPGNGPGIVPQGYESESSLLAVATPTATPKPGSPAVYTPKFEFCGLAIDPQDNMYIVDLVNPVGYSLMRFDRDGYLTARWPVPDGYEPASGCVAADANHIYLSSRQNQVYILDHQAHQQRVVQLDFAPLGSVINGKQDLMVAGPTLLANISGDTGRIITNTIPTEAGPVQIPLLATGTGEVLMSDHTAGHIVRLDPAHGRVLSTIGEFGKWPGQFGDIGGLAADARGRIYVSDYRNRVIQRFTPDGKIDAVWWARGSGAEAGGEID